MGGCASKPNDLDIKPEAVPTEAPAAATEVSLVADAPKAEGETVIAQENVKDVVETQPEEPLVDLSEPKEEVVDTELSVEAKSADVEVVSELIAAATPPAEETVDAKEEETIKEVEEEVKEVANVEDTPVVEAEKKDEAPAAASSDDKSDAPLVTV